MKHVLLGAGILLLLAAPASAMEILYLDRGMITIGVPTTFPDGEGGEFFTTFTGAIVKVAGPRLSIIAAQNLIFTTPLCGFGCAPGQQIDVGWQAVDWGAAWVTLDGVTHFAGPGFAGPGGDLLLFDLAVSVTVPPFGDAPGQTTISTTISFPFAIDPHSEQLSRFIGPLGGPFPDSHRLYGLQGAGHFEMTFLRDGPDLWRSGGATFQLEPIPEPATLLLFATTTAGLGAARWLKGRRHGRDSHGERRTVSENKALDRL